MVVRIVAPSDPDHYSLDKTTYQIQFSDGRWDHASLEEIEQLYLECQRVLSK